MTGLTSLSTARRTKTIISLLAIVTGTGIFVAMWHSVMTHADFARLDQPVLDLLISHRSSTATAAMEAITNLLAPVTFALIVTLGCIAWSVRRHEAWRPLLLMGAMATAMIVSTLIKGLVARSRPSHTFMLAPYEIDYSFPSGHTIGIAVFVLVLSYLLYSRRVSVGHTILWAITGSALIALVALSRLYLGYHWITDVSASVGLALIILGIVIVVDTYAPRRLKAWVVDTHHTLLTRSKNPAK